MHSFGDPAVWLKDIFLNAGLSYNLASILSTTGLVLIVLGLSWLTNFIAKKIILKIVGSVVKKTTSVWDDIFLEQKVFERLSHFAPALVIWFMAGWALKDFPVWMAAVQRLTYIYMVLAGTVVVISFINAWHHIYLTLPVSRHRTIKGFVQIIKLFVIIIAILIIISVVFKKEVGTLIAGLGAMAAVLSLIFKDAILGLVASIQLAGNNMLKIGDWITIPSRGVDGVTEDITLTTVKIRNFDKTIITIPVYALVSDSFQNWKGMEESGLRQIKRSLSIDMRSIKFADDTLLSKIRAVPLMAGYFGKTKSAHEHDMTNLAYFRIYAELYLKDHALIDNEQSLLIRHREPDGNGLPVQVYAYCKNNSWVPFEHVQSEIMEHLIAILGTFDLKIFQQPTGEDLRTFSGTN